ncbi:MAG: hypothetical protein ABW169_02055 [Sphingobium sp.]
MVRYKQFLLLTLVAAPLIVDLAARNMQPPQTEAPVDTGTSAPPPPASGGTVTALPSSGTGSVNMMQGQQSASLDGIDPTPAMDPTPALSPPSDPPPAPPSPPAPVADASGAVTASAPPAPQNY